MENSEFWKKTAHYGAVLTIVCAVAATALGFIFKSAKPEITKKEHARIQADLLDLFTEDEVVFTGYPDSKPWYWEASRKEKLISYVVIGEAKGYSSTIKVLVRTDLDISTVIRIKVSSSQETPGLGERIKETKSKNTIFGALSGSNTEEGTLRPWFQEENFDNRPIDKLNIVPPDKEGVHAISGATISSNAVVEAVKNGISKLKEAIGERK